MNSPLWFGACLVWPSGRPRRAIGRPVGRTNRPAFLPWPFGACVPLRRRHRSVANGLFPYTEERGHARTKAARKAKSDGRFCFCFCLVSGPGPEAVSRLAELVFLFRGPSLVIGRHRNWPRFYANSSCSSRVSLFAGSRLLDRCLPYFSLSLSLSLSLHLDGRTPI